MKLIFLFFGLFVAGSLQNPIEEEWEAFKTRYNKKYEDEAEEELRKKVFTEIRLKIVKHNQKYDEGLVSYRQAINKFADILDNEIDAFQNRDGLSEINRANLNFTGDAYISPTNRKLPVSVDWRTEGAVTKVKNQGGCGSCWAFASIAGIESQYFMKNKKLVSLSEQNLIDCSHELGNNGCTAGGKEGSFQYVKENGGIDTEESYPYDGKVGECRYDPKNSGAKVTGFVAIPADDEEKLTEAVANVGPVVISLVADWSSFGYYNDGVYVDPDDSKKDMFHSMLVVGYGTEESGGDYYILKNSWGEDWNNDGYMKMARNKNNNCGIASRAAYPLVE